MLKCPGCGHDNGESSNFCANCGTALSRGVSGDTTRVIPLVPDEPIGRDLSADDLRAAESLPPESALLVVLRGPDSGARYVINSDVTTAGRHPRCDIFLDDITVSRNHARFVRRAGRIWVSDQNSLNGTYVNRSLIDHEVALRQGDEVQIGKYRLVFFSGNAG